MRSNILELHLPQNNSNNNKNFFRIFKINWLIKQSNHAQNFETKVSAIAKFYPLRVSIEPGNREKPGDFFNRKKPWKPWEFYLEPGISFNFYCKIYFSLYFIFLLHLLALCALVDKFRLKCSMRLLEGKANKIP